MKRIISLLLVVVICCTMLPYAYINASATSVSQYSPHVNIEYGYTTSVKCGTIRYIAQIPTHTNYFFWDYWPASGSLKNYSTPNVECGTACISMALSFVGVNKTPYDILKPYDGTTMFIDWGEADAVKYTYSNLETAFERYQNGNGKYSPPVIHLDKYSSAGHFVLLIGKIDSDIYQVLDPANQKLWEITINGSVATYNHPNGGAAKTDTIDRSGRSDDVHQWYNPNATPPLVTESYPSYCTVKVTSSSSNIKSLPCSVATDPNSETIETASKNDTYTAIGLYKNTAGNLWYKVKAKNGSTGYLYAGEAAFEKQLTDDVSVSGVSAPTELKVGSSYSIKGTIAAQHQTITKVGAWVEDINGDYATGATEDVNTQSYKLGSSKVDKGVVFGDLTAGIYHYFIGAIVKTNYASDAKTVSSKSVTIDLYESEFKVVSNVACSHSYSNSVTTAATCASAGVRTYTCSKCGDSYTEAIPATGNHSYGAWTTVTAASCTANGVQKKVCSVCGDAQTQSISATGHSYSGWVTVSSAGCTTTGTKHNTCSACGDVQSQTIPATGHNYQSAVIDATCSEPEKVRYTCQNCGHSYENFTSDEYSEWSTSRPTGVDESLIETKTQYRYSDYEKKTSYESTLSGYELIASTWEQSGTGYADCVKSWPSGYLTSHSLYGEYNKTQKTNSETATDKTVVTSDQIVGYLYYHWCRGTYANGPINRKVSEVQTSTFCAFHSFYSTVNPSTLTADTDYSYVYANGDCCKDSHWYFCVPVYRQYYDNYRKLFTYGRWGGWSSWSDTVYAASDTRKVETQTLYRYANTQLGEHTWDDGVQTIVATCTHAGELTYTCTSCGTTRTETLAMTSHVYQNGYCVNCSSVDPDYVFQTAQLQAGNVSGNAGDTVTVPVVISNNPGFAGFTLVFDYDTSAMTLTDITKGEVLNASESGAFTKNVNGNALNWTDAVNTTGNGVVFNLTFKISNVVLEGNYAVTVGLKDENKTNFVDENGHAQKIEFHNGTIVVEDKAPETNAKIAVSSSKGVVGQTVSVMVSLEDNPGFNALNLAVVYDEGVLKLESAENLVDELMMTSLTAFVWDGAADYTADGNLLKLTFKVADNAPEGDYAIQIKFLGASNESFEEVQMVTESGTITVSAVVFGDTNGDGRVTTVDLSMLRKYFASINPETGISTIAVKAGADVNGDGKISTVDLSMLRKYFASIDPNTGESSIVLGPK